MYMANSKKLLIFDLLDILKRYTDENHRFSQQEISHILEREYGVCADRKTIKRNLMDLIDAGYDLEYRESTRINRQGEEESLLTDWYLSREFTNSELRLLIDSLLFSRHIPYAQRQQLIGKLEGLSSRYFHSHMGYVRTLPDISGSNNQLFYTIEILDEAIQKGVQVAFRYQEYGMDKHLHFRRDQYGQIREYIVNPYQMAAVNGRYYLICNLDKYDAVSNYRLDRIADIRLLSTPVKEQAKVKGLEHGLNLPQHMAEHIYMFAGESIHITFRADKRILNDIMDWFSAADFSNEREDTIDVTVKVNRQAMFCWAMQYGPYVEVLKPAELREELGQSFAQIAKIYEKDSL
jgi:predicted DNA-binding transcriptional regulator YafY